MGRARRLGLLTGGGDCPGQNAVLRAVVKSAGAAGACQVLGVQGGFAGLVEARAIALGGAEVRGVLARGGTVLGAGARPDPARWRGDDGVERDVTARVGAGVEALELDAVVVLGGEAVLDAARRLDEALGVPFVGVPTSAAGDLRGTDATVGFHSARAVCTAAMDRLASAADAGDRVSVLEVLGLATGRLALEAGVAGGADAILVPEIPWDAGALAVAIARRRRRGRTHGVVVVAEGARPAGAAGAAPARPPRLAGRGEVRAGTAGAEVARAVAAALPVEVRVTELGALQRCGGPTPEDRLLALRFGVAAARLAAAGARGRMVALRGGAVEDVPLADARGRRPIDPAGELVALARALGTSFGDPAEARP